MKTIQLFRDGKEILGSDGIVYADGRFNWASIVRTVRQKNDSMKTNFPHKVADRFAVYSDGIGSALHSHTNL